MLNEKLMDDLKIAMREKNDVRKNTVQMVRAAILQIEKDKGIEVDDNKILEMNPQMKVREMMGNGGEKCYKRFSVGRI